MCKIILTESNVIDIYCKLSNKEEISKEELEPIKKRFRELAGI